MKSKMTVAIVAICVGMIAGWLMRSGVVPREAVADADESHVKELEFTPTAPTPRPDGQSTTPLPDEGREIGDNDAQENESPTPEDGMEERMVRRGIQSIQSTEDVRQAIIENANLDEAQIEQLDKVVAEMNRQMLDVSIKWADHIRETGTLDMDTRLRMQHDINGVSVSFSDRMDKEFPGWRGENTDLTRLVRVTTAFEPFRKIRSEILRGEMRKTQHQDDDGAQETNADE